MTDQAWNPHEVILVVSHPFADLDMPLAAWMATGPGPRHGTRPIAARSRTTGEALPLTVIPRQYRNDRETRALIAAGKLDSPWRHLPWRDDWGERPCELYGPRPFDGTVDDPDRIDLLTARVLDALPPGDPDPETAARVLADVPDFAAAAAPAVRRLAARSRHAELDAVVRLAAAAGLADVAPVLCQLIESDAAPPRISAMVSALGRHRCEDAVDLMEPVLHRRWYAHDDLAGVRACLRALAGIGTNGSRARLHIISWRDLPEPIPRWAAEEALAGTGVALGEFAADGTWTPGIHIPGWRP